jgi:ubiquinone/menaquinone biosynthesis C-methylase UbiE
MKRVDYDERLHEVYVRGRAMVPSAIAVWLAAFERRWSDARPLTLLDLGSGTGRWTPHLAQRFGGPVYGVEPSEKMRAVATASSAHDQVTYLAGSGESIPLEDASCDGALAFFVWHHVQDQPRAAAELLRVIRPGGRLIMRTNFSDRMPPLWWYEAFPRAGEVDAQIYRPLDVALEELTAAGWEFVTLDEVAAMTAETRRQDLDRLQLRALSTFEHLAEAEVDAGFAALESSLQEDGAGDIGPVVTTGDLLILQRPE